MKYLPNRLGDEIDDSLCTKSKDTAEDGIDDVLFGVLVPGEE